ncbi:MAG TPA: sodium:proton exchanger, partial [bacterium]|nr:sodium:proton exchanger [bacterium]
MTAAPLLSGVAIGIVVAALLAYLATLTRQPFLLAYLAAGALIGPRMGFGLIRDTADVQSISELGL